MAVQTQIQTRRGTAATWTSTNPTLAAGEIGFETDTGKFKIGDGSTAWAALAYNLNGGVSTSGGSTITVASGTTVPLTIQNNGTGNSFVVNDEASDTSPFVIDSSGNIGVGTTSPGAKLDIIGPTGTVTAPTYPNQTAMAIRNNFHTRIVLVNGGAGTYTSQIYSFTPGGANPTHDFAMSPNGFVFLIGNTAGSVAATERMRIGIDGLVGINGAASGTQFYVNNGTAANVGAIIKGAASQTGDLLQVQNSAGTSLLKVDSSGNVGIGTTSPTYKLDVQNSGGDLYLLRLTNTNSANTTVKYSSMIFAGTDTVGAVKPAIILKAYPEDANYVNSGFIIATRSADAVTDRLTINSSGNVGIGTSAPAAKLDVNGSIKSDNLSTNNRIINGAFDIWQRGTSFGGGQYGADRFNSGAGSNAFTITQVAGIGGSRYAAKLTQTGSNSFTQFGTQIEFNNCYDLQNQTVTISFVAQANNTNSGSTDFTVRTRTIAGVDGACLFTGTASNTNFTITTTATKYTITKALPATFGSLSLEFVTNAGVTGDGYTISNIKLELGSVATPFTRAGGTIQGELAACQRYYWSVANGVANQPIGTGFYYSATVVETIVPFPVTMRIAPSIVQSSGTNYFNFLVNGGNDQFNSFSADQITTNMAGINNTTNVSGTAGQAGYITLANTSAALAFSAEL